MPFLPKHFKRLMITLLKNTFSLCLQKIHRIYLYLPIFPLWIKDTLAVGFLFSNKNMTAVWYWKHKAKYFCIGNYEKYFYRCLNTSTNSLSGRVISHGWYAIIMITKPPSCYVMYIIKNYIGFIVLMSQDCIIKVHSSCECNRLSN